MNPVPSVLACLAALSLSGQLGAAEFRAGMPLGDALEALRDDGLAIVYSSDLITRDMQVAEVPSANTPGAQLEELLASWELAVQPGPDGVLLIVRDGKRAAANGRLTGLVLNAFDGTPLAGAEVVLGRGRYVTLTDSNGRFLFDNVAAGKYRLTVNYEATRYARRARAEVQPGQTASVVLEMDGVYFEALDELVVNASRYQFGRDLGPSVVQFSAADLELMPDFGDDPLRAVSHVPGTTSNDFTARANMRGGWLDENLVVFDGLRLYNPYHMKDFQGLFGAVDSRLVANMDVATGGFPVSYGDRMSGVIDIQTIVPDEEFYGEVSVSFFNLSTLLAGQYGDTESYWLVSARKGNLAWVIDLTDPTLGEPRYEDAHMRLSHQFSDTLTISANALLYDDELEVIDPDEEEFAFGDYRDEYLWLRFDITPMEELAGTVLVARTELESERMGTVEKEGATSGSLFEEKDFRITSLQTDWSWWLADDWLFQFGGEFRDQEGFYFYTDDAEFELLFDIPGVETDPIRDNLRSKDFEGHYYALYGSLRNQMTDKLTVEAGLRWNKETLSAENDTAVDPRFSLLYEFNESTRGRAGIGRYSQSQAVNELDFADNPGGGGGFAPFEHVDQYVLSLEHDFTSGITARIEGYSKQYDDLRPRYENFLDNFSYLPQLWPDRIKITATEAHAQGVELTVRKADEGPWGWWLTYAWSRVEDEDPGRDASRSWDQDRSVSGGLSWQTPEWEFSLTGSYHRGWPTTSTGPASDDPVPLVESGPRNNERFKKYVRVDGRIARNYEFSNNNRLTVFFELHNLTNRKNDCCAHYELDDEDGPLEYASDVEDQIPGFPSVGFIWQF